MRRYLGKIVILTVVIVLVFFITLVVGSSPTRELKDEYQKAPKIKANYQLIDSALVRVVKSDPRDKLEVTIGERVKPTSQIQGFINKIVKLAFAQGVDAGFSPKVTIARWDNEVNVVFESKAIKSVAAKDKTLKFEGDKIKFETPDIDYSLYEMPKDPNYPEGAFEYEAILKKKPTTNIVEFDIEAKGVSFTRQPALTEIYQSGYSSNYRKEVIVTRTEVKDLEGNILEGASEDHIGSYVIYTSEEKTNWEGGKLYRTGKVGEVSYPFLIDANNQKVKAEDLRINFDGKKGTGTMIITIPQNFLDNASYPITVDPTFGYTTTPGTSQYTNIRGQIGGVNGTPAQAGTVSRITASLAGGTTTHPVKGALYKNSDSTLVAETSEVTIPIQSQTWTDLTFSTQPNVTNQTYIIAAFGGGSEGNIILYRDTSVSGYTRYLQVTTYPTFPDPATFSTASSIAHGIYATYTPPVLRFQGIKGQGIKVN